MPKFSQHGGSADQTKAARIWIHTKEAKIRSHSHNHTKARIGVHSHNQSHNQATKINILEQPCANHTHVPPSNTHTRTESRVEFTHRAAQSSVANDIPA